MRHELALSFDQFMQCSELLAKPLDREPRNDPDHEPTLRWAQPPPQRSACRTTRPCRRLWHRCPPRYRALADLRAFVDEEIAVEEGQTELVRWEEFQQQAPTFAELGRRRLGDPGVVLVGTIRSDGSPRVSPVEPLFWNGDLWLSMGWRTRKAGDLRRDSRILVHNIVTDREGTSGEFKVRGNAIPVDDAGVQQRRASPIRNRSPRCSITVAASEMSAVEPHRRAGVPRRGA